MKTMEECPFRVGDKVLVSQSARMPAWAKDWAGEPQFIVGITWEYQKAHDSRVNIALASETAMEHGDGSTDGFRVEHLEPFK